MSIKPKGKQPIDISLSAVIVRKNSSVLAETFEIVIENGVVTELRPLMRAPDTFAASIAKGTQALWNHLRGSK